MRVPSSDLDGAPLADIDLSTTADGRLTIDGQLVITIQVIGSRVALTIIGAQRCVRAQDYVRVRHGAGADAG